MKKLAGTTMLTVLLVVGCSKNSEGDGSGAAALASAPVVSNTPPLDSNNIVSIALASKDHTTLVAALKAADYVTSVSNAGPLTVFAPTNAAFAKLPSGTVEGLVKPDKKDELREVLKYHATTSSYQASDFKDGQTLAMSNGAKVTFHVKDGKVMVNDANIIASAKASNGVVHIIDAVLLAPAAPTSSN